MEHVSLRNWSGIQGLKGRGNGLITVGVILIVACDVCAEQVLWTNRTLVDLLLSHISARKVVDGRVPLRIDYRCG